MSSVTFAESNPLESFRWEYRLILIYTPTEEIDGALAKLKAAEPEIKERHILWFVFSERESRTNNSDPIEEDFRTEVLRHYFEDGETTQLRLIGKDGGIKEKADKLILERIFSLIDAMPMRQAEMKRN
ncbi:DUF4174 domain-containing protein [Coraliomargarita sinensis]|nr:DUF4174 domain-containing protein [Coraliomargarita sinensis]